MSLSVTSTHLLNTPRDSDSNTPLGTLIQCLTTLSVKKSFLTPDVNLPYKKDLYATLQCPSCSEEAKTERTQYMRCGFSSASGGGDNPCPGPAATLSLIQARCYWLSWPPGHRSAAVISTSRSFSARQPSSHSAWSSLCILYTL